MKKLILFAFGLLLAPAMIAQSAFSWKDDVQTIQETFHNDMFYTASIYIENESGAPLTLGWTKIEDNLPTAWNLSMCDYTACYAGIPASGTMTEITGTTEAFLKLTINATQVNDGGLVKILVFDSNNPSDADTATFDLTSADLTGLAENTPQLEMDLFPNPTADGKVIISNPMNSKIQVRIISLTGAEMQRTIIAGQSNTELNLSHLPSGIYLVQSNDGNSVLTKRLVIQ